MHMSEETLTPQTDTKKQEYDPSEGNPFISTAADRSRRFVSDGFSEQSENQNDTNNIENSDTTESVTKKKSFNTGLAVGAIATAVLGGAGVAVHAANQGPEFSESTSEYVVQPGDGLYNAAEDITGVDSIDIRDAVQHISVDPANIDVLKDGLQAGETVVIPDSVK